MKNINGKKYYLYVNYVNLSNRIYFRDRERGGFGFIYFLF